MIAPLRKSSSSTTATAAIAAPPESNFVSWRAVAPILANVIASPWNLLVGGLLVTNLSIADSVLSIILGYAILSVLTLVYGGLGFRTHRTTSELIEPVFGVRGSRIVLSSILAIGQLGWFAIIVRIAGESLAAITGFSLLTSILAYSLLMAGIAALSIARFGSVKFVITACVMVMVVNLLLARASELPALINSTQVSTKTIAWGTSIVIASLISFIAVTPDFFRFLNSKSDVNRSILYGVFIPGVVFTSCGALLFLGVTNISLAKLVLLSSAPIAAHAMNLLGNTDASVALYTPIQRFRYMFNLQEKWALLLALGLGSLLALLNIDQQLEQWLSVLGAVFPSLIGITVARYSLYFFGLRDRAERFRTNWKGVSIITGCSLLVFLVNVSLLPWLTAILSFFLYILMTGVTISITIGSNGSRVRN